MAVDLEILLRPAPRPDLFEDLLLPVRGGVPSDDGVRERWSIPAAESPDRLTPEGIAAALAAGGGVLVDLWSLDAHDAADLLIAAAHGGVGFGPGLQPEAETPEQVWTLLSGAVAAIVGEDVRVEWEACGRGVAGPSAERRAFIGGLARAARETIRDVVTVVRVPEEACAPIAETFPEVR